MNALPAKYYQSWEGVKVRIHRMILQLIFITVFIYLMGWVAFFLAVWTFVVLELVPYGRIDRWINPWFRRAIAEGKKETVDGMKQFLESVDLRELGVEQEFIKKPPVRCEEAVQEIFSLDNEAYQRMGDLHQLTIDLIQQVGLEAVDSVNFDRERLCSLRYEVESVLDVISPAYLLDVALLNRLAVALKKWDDDKYW